jgi:nitrogen fixation protein FixH
MNAYARPMPHRRPLPQRAWNRYPWILAASMGVVFAVNIAMVWWALSTFPGELGNDGFDLGNIYDRILAAKAEQDARGWTVAAEAAAGEVLVRLADASGPLPDATVSATASRPLGPSLETPLTFHHAADGRYVANATLPALGQWDLMLRIDRAAGTLRVTRRIVAR